MSIGDHATCEPALQVDFTMKEEEDAEEEGEGD